MAGSQTHRGTDTASWPAFPATGTIQGQVGENAGDGGFWYQSTGTQGSSLQGGRLINNTAAAIDLTGARLDVGITFTRLPTGSIDPRLFVSLNNQSFQTGFDTTETVTNAQQNMQVDFTDLAGERMWNLGLTGSLDFVIFDSANPRDYDYTVDFIRIRTDGTDTPFDPTGGGGAGTAINEGISETINGLNLNQFYGVDDGEA